MKDTDEVKQLIQTKMQEILTLLTDNGYDAADISLDATPRPYSGQRSIYLTDEFDWAPSTSWQGSNC